MCLYNLSFRKSIDTIEPESGKHSVSAFVSLLCNSLDFFFEEEIWSIHIKRLKMPQSVWLFYTTVRVQLLWTKNSVCLCDFRVRHRLVRNSPHRSLFIFLMRGRKGLYLGEREGGDEWGGSHNQDILCKRDLFSIRGGKKQSWEPCLLRWILMTKKNHFH